MTVLQASCPLCSAPQGVGTVLLWQDADWRVVRVEEPGFPAFYRVIHQHHVAEWSDLEPAQREACMRLMVLVESAMRSVLQPTKVNLAALGNMVPHLHWHVVARFDWDSHFPASPWSAPLRARDLVREGQVQALLPQVDAQIVQALSASAAGGAQ